MKIALCFPGCFRRGGVERVVLATANGLAERGHEVHVFAKRAETQELHEAVCFHCVDAPSSPGPWALARFPVACKRAMIESGLVFDVTGGFGVACPPSDVAWVQSVHARWLEVSRGDAGGTFGQRVRRRLNPFHAVALSMERRRFGHGGHRQLLALTGDVANDLKQFYDVESDRCAVLPNGYDPQAFNPSRAAELRNHAREQFGLSVDEPVVVFVANESQRKGLPVLLESVGRMQRPEVKVLAVGRLPEAEVRAAAEAVGMAKQLIMPGPVDDVTLAYAAGDVFALPTVYEAWGLVIVEAMACGIPVVTSELAGAAEAVNDGNNGWLLQNPDDVEALTRCLESAMDTLPMTAQDRSESVASYRWSRIIERYEAHLLAAVEAVDR